VSRPYSPAGVHIRLSFPDASPDVRIEPFDPLTTTVSFFLDNDPSKWRPRVPVYSDARYVDLYPRVDLVLGGADATGNWRHSRAPRPARCVYASRVRMTRCLSPSSSA
jgi:hypothetical protein